MDLREEDEQDGLWLDDDSISRILDWTAENTLLTKFVAAAAPVGLSVIESVVAAAAAAIDNTQRAVKQPFRNNKNIEMPMSAAGYANS